MKTGRSLKTGLILKDRPQTIISGGEVSLPLSPLKALSWNWSEQPMIEIKKLYKIYGSRTEEAMRMLKENCSKEMIKKKTGGVLGLTDINLSIDDDEVFVIMGLSGSGKSTLVRCINRLVEPTSGEIFIDHKERPEQKIQLTSLNKNELREVRKNRISMVFQHSALLPHLTVIHNILFGPMLQGKIKEQKSKNRKP